MDQLKRIGWAAVGWGVFVDFFLTQLLQLGVSMAIGITPDTDPSLAESMIRSSGAYWPLFVMGILFTGLGGYLAGRLAGREEVFHGTLAGFISNILLGLLLFSASMDVLEMVGVMLAVVAGTVGGWVAGATKKRTI